MLLSIFSEIKDARRRQGVRYELTGVLSCVLLALLSGATSYRKIITFMEERYDLLKDALGLQWKRVPSYAGLRLIVQNLDKEELEKAFRKHSASLVKADSGGEFLACDGKALRHSFDRMEDKKAAEMLSVFASEESFVLAHAEIKEKTNEIPAFQALIRELGLTGKVFTLDALHAQKNS